MRSPISKRAGTPSRIFTLALLLSGAAAVADAATTELVNRDGEWLLLRDGQPFVIRGAAGGGDKKLLAKLGGNSFRTWGADNLDAQLDEAHELGLAVTVGIWIGHERHGFDYSDPQQVRQQFEKAKAAIVRYKDHPAVLMWAIGNEMEGFGAGDNPAIWQAVNDIAKMAKEIDPTRPTMTVMAEIGGERLHGVHELCPDVDIVGVNSYGGASSLAKRYREAGGKKPIVVTEFGPHGTWESAKTEFGALIEPTSTQKAEQYRHSYESLMRDGKGLVLGAYAFTWGAKQEATPTWFGMLLRDGSRVAAADVMSELWTGRPVENRCPRIEPMQVSPGLVVNPGHVIEASVAVKDPEDGPLQFEWVLQKEVEKRSVGGDREQAPPVIDGAVEPTGNGTARVKMPLEPGGYRLYVYVRDGQGGAATANAPLQVQASRNPNVEGGKSE